MEWLEITAKTLEEAREMAADRLGVGEDEIETEVLEEPRTGLFGKSRGSARIRARVKPAELRPKQDRRRSRRKGTAERAAPRGGRRGAGRGGERSADRGVEGGAVATMDDESDVEVTDDRSERGGATRQSRDSGGASRGRRGGSGGRGGEGRGGNGRRGGSGGGDDRDEQPAEDVDPAAVGAAAVSFMEGLAEAFGTEATVELLTDGVDLDVRLHGEGLGLMVGSGGRTLLAIQDLVRVAAQRRLGDHTTRLKIDIAGYRERRREALEKFALGVAQQVIDSGVARAMEPMPSADRKVVHDVLLTIDGVESHSEGDDPDRRVVVSPV